VVVHEKINNHKIRNYKRGKDENHDSGKDESSTELETEFTPALRAQEFLINLTLLVEDKVKNGEHQHPFHRPREDLSIVQEGKRDRQIQDILVEQSNQVVLAPHEAIGNV
jgi:hypothetical protein